MLPRRRLSPVLAAAVLADALGPPIFSALPLERPRWLALGLLAIRLIGLAFLAFARIGEVLLTFIATAFGAARLLIGAAERGLRGLDLRGAIVRTLFLGEEALALLADGVELGEGTACVLYRTSDDSRRAHGREVGLQDLGDVALQLAQLEAARQPQRRSLAPVDEQRLDARLGTHTRGGSDAVKRVRSSVAAARASRTRR